MTLPLLVLAALRAWLACLASLHVVGAMARKSVHEAGGNGQRQALHLPSVLRIYPLRNT